MSEQDMQKQIDKATTETIVSLIGIYFKVVQAILFLVALIFAVIIVGVMLAGKVLLAAIKLVATVSAQAKGKQRIGATI